MDRAYTSRFARCCVHNPHTSGAHYLENGYRYTWLQYSTYRKWHLGYQMIAWPVLSRDLKGQGRTRDPDNIWMQISRKRLKMETRFQQDTNKKWNIMPDRLVTWPMTSRDLERSRTWPQYACGLLSRKWLEIQTYRVQWSTYRKWHMGYQMVTWPETSREPEWSRWWPHIILFGWNILKSVRVNIGQTSCSLNIILS